MSDLHVLACELFEEARDIMGHADELRGAISDEQIEKIKEGAKMIGDVLCNVVDL